MAIKILVEVVYALQHYQHIINIEIEQNSTVLEAIQYSGILKIFNNINFKINKVGIYGKIVNLNDIIHNGDRIEIYRPLFIDPVILRRNLANKK